MHLLAMLILITLAFILFFQLSVTDVKFMLRHLCLTQEFLKIQLLLLMSVFFCDRCKTSEILDVLLSLTHRLLSSKQTHMSTMSGKMLRGVRISKWIFCCLAMGSSFTTDFNRVRASATVCPKLSEGHSFCVIHMSTV